MAFPCRTFAVDADVSADPVGDVAQPVPRLPRQRFLIDECVDGLPLHGLGAEAGGEEDGGIGLPRARWVTPKGLHVCQGCNSDLLTKACDAFAGEQKDRTRRHMSLLALAPGASSSTRATSAMGLVVPRAQ